MVSVLLVTQDGCSPCKRIKRIVEETKQLNPLLEVREVKFSSPEGIKLASDYGILYPPAVFIDQKFFAKGKIQEEQLKNALLGPRASIKQQTMKS